MTCNFDVGDRVQVAPNLCGTVLQRLPFGSDVNLLVQLPNGQTMTVPCRGARPCTMSSPAMLPPAAKAAPAGAAKPKPKPKAAAAKKRQAKRKVTAKPSAKAKSAKKRAKPRSGK